ncbi:Prefoldin subunit 6 [Seminavis robusta]|uniref:Prefoldin subunit 6 n=1 Tax=Seminavis robusta TaxID=568900 RepID=A0A9N8DKX4_9STRA|nr:Prefoldin subunit 6 [Seminavis robusta]|eukprot:Sro198_g084250.1 Prefoldin subunit 6 (146) ;mRNA; r:91986-92423
MATSASDPNNPGNTLASAVDAEIAKFRELQEQLHGLRGDLQVVMGQQTENEMVQTELNLLKDDVVYKRVGPALVRQELDDAKETVSKRLEFISKEQDKLKAKMSAMEKQLDEKGRKIAGMQTDMQRMTAQAVQAIQQQHTQQKAS